LERLGATNFNRVVCEVVGEARKLFCGDSGFRLLDPRKAFVELHLDDPVRRRLVATKPSGVSLRM
jgi:hypothetical protein